MKRTRMTRRTVVTNYEIDVEAVADAMLSDDWTRQLIAGWVRRGGGRSHANRPGYRID